MKNMIIIIGGGSVFNSYEEYVEHLKSCEVDIENLDSKWWADDIALSLPDFRVINLEMPNTGNAKYNEWEIWFKKVSLLLSDNVVLIGHSLGGIFLAKYLIENKFPKKVRSLHLISSPYDTEIIKESLGDFAHKKTLEDLATYTDKIFLYQSKDDLAVAYKDAMKYKRDIPIAKLRMFEDRGHFNQEKFIELVEDIKTCI